ncbi:MAG: ATP-binding cassette domain-containing protein [Clostridia bacterium]|nr:ATP-binding cassette domain-containing protein [Clostridia bacterium]
MLQLQNITKVYKTKAGEVKALNGISLTFPERGLVFITGKSGCGKTTLLNVIGGLDGIDEGEILIQDKKFSAFSAAEYDSYRNTFIGFIFQDYNLLPEYTVEKNIKIAMELQGRKVDTERLKELLADMEIEDLKNRKPSELSGGQRQRVAIVRALVKEPRIIMADEPTGALDSGTGLQVLEVLKKLSKNTLVIVVSHDREFAEKYADRIVHLEDGKVVQDVTFTEKDIEGNIEEQGNTFVVREGADLSETEKNALAKAVKERKSIEIIENPCFREKAETGEVKHNADNPVSLRKSKMKLRSATYLGVKSLTVKPIRLVITILIAALAFAVFGLFDTIANFSTAKVLKNQLKVSSTKTVMATSDYIVDYDSGDRYTVKISQAQVEEIEDQTGGTVKGIFDLKDNLTGSEQTALSITEIGSSNVTIGKRYYSKSVSGFIEFDEAEEISSDGEFEDFDYEIVAGNYPKLYKDEDGYEIAVSAYLADSILHYLNGNPLNGKEVAAREDLLDAKITVAGQKYKIVGIIDCGGIPEKYDTLAEVTQYNVSSATLANDFNAYIDSGAQKCLFVPKGFLQDVKTAKNSADIFYVGNTTWSIAIGEEKTRTQASTYLYKAEGYGTENLLFFDEQREQSGDSLADDEILLHILNVDTMFKSKVNGLTSAEHSEVKKLLEYIQLGRAENNRDTLQTVFRKLNVNIDGGKVYAKIHQRFTETGVEKVKDVKIVGVYFGVDTNNYTIGTRYKLMMNKNLMKELKVFEEQGDYCKVLFSERSVRKGGNAIVDYFMSENGLALHWYNNSVLNEIRTNETTIRQFARLFLYADIALSIFAIFMLYNYISMSIANKKRSVGVLRALGAGKKDILRTFLSESLIICIINGILANLFAVLGCALVNMYIVEVMNISVHFALFGIRQIFLIFGVSLLTAFASSTLPIVKISKKKPVELIRRS